MYGVNTLTMYVCMYLPSSIGSLGKYNAWAQVSNVVVDGAFISDTENGVRIKTWQVISLSVSSSPFSSYFMYMSILSFYKIMFSYAFLSGW